MPKGNMRRKDFHVLWLRRKTVPPVFAQRILQTSMHNNIAHFNAFVEDVYSVLKLVKKRPGMRMIRSTLQRFEYVLFLHVWLQWLGDV